MSNLSKDIQCVGSDTRPPMLDRTDFASWQQCIRLYYRGKENGVNILKSIDEGPFQMRTVREPLAEGTEREPLLGPERPRVYSDLSPKEKDRVDRIEVRGPIHGVKVQLGGQDNAIDEDVDEQPVQDLALNMDNVFQADDCDAFDSDVDEAPTAQTMFMANLSSTYHVNDEAGPSYDSDILSEYVKDNVVPVVYSIVSSVPNDAYMMIYNDMYEPHAQPVSKTSRNTVVENSLTAELATYKEQVELYERWARFELIEREQKINEQLRLVISDCNIKKETLKNELHSVKLQLASTINHNKLLVEDRLFKQDQSLQTVHMLCRPKPYYNELNNVAIGYKNPLSLIRAKQVQPALYNGHEIIKDNHVPAIVHNTEDTLKIAEITRRKMNDKMKDPECVTLTVKIAYPRDTRKSSGTYLIS
nr:integrase, catalytic region, zinc finger, CCHC-type, peptidase aspartic, catalytic [Tanacetum cinerariifolium]